MDGRVSCHDTEVEVSAASVRINRLEVFSSGRVVFTETAHLETDIGSITLQTNAYLELNDNQGSLAIDYFQILASATAVFKAATSINR